ncbi:Mrr restriction endonuclease [mine drainage metagenome]|uniref:Mrr restriction endonuclease n=1 Tax=mine drainage metagenome TaxID=410659 RepID=T1BGV9_9ZZZZ
MLRALFELLRVAPEGLQASEALRQLALRVQLTPYEAGDYESGGRRFEKIVRFATVDCVKAGWLSKHKGVWVLSTEGLRAYERWTDPEAFYRAAVRLYHAWKRAQPDAPLADSTANTAEVASFTNASAAEIASLSLDQAEELAWTAITQFLNSMPPYLFQQLVGDLLSAMGYHVAWVAPPGKDGGTDLLAYNDPLGTRPPRIKVQVKRNAESARIDVQGLRSFMAVLGDEDIGIFVALSGSRATPNRKYAARAVVASPCWTWAASSIYGPSTTPRLDDAARRRFPLRPVWFLASAD